MSIQYKTEGRLEIPGARNTEKIVVTWVTGEVAVRLHCGGDHIAISKDQLVFLRDHIEDICGDLSS